MRGVGGQKSRKKTVDLEGFESRMRRVDNIPNDVDRIGAFAAFAYK